MPTLVLRENIPPVAKAPGKPVRQASEAKPDRSLEGVLIFSGIGFALMVLDDHLPVAGIATALFLEPRFRSSQPIAATSEANYGIKGAPATH